MIFNRKVLVIGARPESLGAAIVKACDDYDYEAVTAGVAASEDHWVNANDQVSVTALFDTIGPVTNVINTVGVNDTEILPGSAEDIMRVFRVNVLSHVMPWRTWLDFSADTNRARSYVSVSSNSAHIARSGSTAYCMSKAALSMWIRCTARASAGEGPYLYGYEPGLIRDTPMTREVRDRLSPEIPLSRIPAGAEGFPASEMADLIVRNLGVSERPLHGCLLRMDGGEQ